MLTLGPFYILTIHVLLLVVIFCADDHHKSPSTPVALLRPKNKISAAKINKHANLSFLKKLHNIETKVLKT